MAIERISAFDQKRFVVTEGPLRFLAAPTAVVTAGGYSAEYELCLIGFVKKTGAIFVTVPGYRGPGGMVASPKYEVRDDGSAVLELSAFGKVATPMVKYSHPPDGHAHFSQDGKVRSEIRRQSFPLTSIGNLCDLHIYHPYGLRDFSLESRATKRPYLRHRFADGLPRAVTVHVEWRRKRDIIDSIQPLGGSCGPVARLYSKRSKQTFQAFLLGQPEGYPLRDFLLVVSVGPAPMLDNIESTTVVFMGGLDPHEIREGDPPPPQTGCLAFIYPQHSLEMMRSRVGTIDFPATTAGASDLDATIA